MKSIKITKTGILIIISAILVSGIIVHFRDGQTGLDRSPTVNVSNSITSNGSEDVIDEELATMYRTIALVEKHYLDAKRINPEKMIMSALDKMQIHVAVLIISRDKDNVEIKIGKHKKNISIKNLTTVWVMLKKFKTVFTFIKDHTKDEKIDYTELQYTAINGMLKTLDPHTVLLTPDYYRSMKDRTHGNFGGLGIVISIRDGELTVVSPIDGTPAQRAGLQAEDVITEISNSSTINMPINDAVSLMRGKPGTICTLRVKRKTWPTEKLIKIERAIIKVTSIDSAVMPQNIGYVRIHDFQANTASDLAEHMKKMTKKGPLKGIILDLRSNPGGLLTAAINIVDLFVKEGAIVTTAGQRLSERTVQRAHNFGTEPDYPIAILVNSGSASASEIVAGALKGHKRAILIGNRTFGKGSVQVLNEFPDKTALKMTTAQYLTPGDISIQSVGISPHVKLFKMRADKEMTNLHENMVYREQDLSLHFESTSDNSETLEKPIVTLKHLHSPVIIEDQSEEDNKKPSDKPKDITKQTTYNFEFEADFEIKLARDILLAMKTSDVSKFDKAKINALFARKQNDETSNLASALNKMGIDWRAQKLADKSTIESSISFEPEQELIPGEQVKMHVTVKNSGETPVYRLLAQTRSDFGYIDQRELAFGYIEPGQTVTRTYKFKMKKNTFGRVDDVKVTFEDFNNNRFKPIAKRFSFKTSTMPVLSFSTHLMDYKDGNGDGRLQKGETVQILSVIKNTGDGDAQNVYVTLSNESGNDLFLSNGRSELKEIKIGETKIAMFEFSLKKDATIKKASLKLGVMDLKLRAYSSANLNYEFESENQVTPISTSVLSKGSPLSIVATPLDGAKVFATIPAMQILKADGETANYYRVIISENEKGWVSKKVVNKTEESNEEPVQITRIVNSPPVISLSQITPVVKNKTITLQGIATDKEKVKDLYIFVNNDKVFYKSGETDKISFKVKLQLEQGSNYITIVAKETEELEARKSVLIRKDRKDGMPFIKQINLEGTPEPLGVMSN